MSGSEDHDGKTEEPTEKRLSEAAEKGNVPFARDVALFGSIAAILAAVLLLGSQASGHLTLALARMLDSSGAMRLDDREAVAQYLSSAMLTGAAATLPVFALIAFGTIAATLLQNPPSAALDRVMPKLNRISIGSGWKRLFGRTGWIEFAKSCLKLVAVSAVVTLTVKAQFGTLAGALHAEPSQVPAMLKGMSVSVLMALAVLSLLLAAVDLAWSRVKWRRDLRMTHREIAEEFKQAEGDPYIKARIRSIGRRRSSRRMLEKLRSATMVITNPTHYAVALRYARDDRGAPAVVAKGVDFMALKIREKAAEFDVPVIENKPLARALYDKVEVDRQIPPEFYRAVAEIIHYLHNRQRPPGARHRP